METGDHIGAAAILRLHDTLLSSEGWPGGAFSERSGVWHWAMVNHRFNRLLWDEEDRARNPEAGPAEIARCKRTIDRYNQQRNDAVEAFDECLLASLGDIPRVLGARLHSETVGAMVDRLSILALKIFHMDIQARRTEAGELHMQACAAKLGRLREQRRDLAACLDQLLADLRQGRAYFKLYRQFKMYNDPTLNPYLYGRGRAP